MSSVQTTAGGNLGIMVQFDDIVFTSASLVKFAFSNTLNSVPSGEMILTDSNSDLLVTQSGDYGSFYFTDTSDNNTAKASTLNFIIDEMNHLSVSGSNTTYQIKWSAGNQIALTNKTRVFKGTSLEAMMDICNTYKHLAIENLTDLEFDKPSDSMTWRYIQDDMWSALDETVSHSYIKNDFLFWVYDDVNSYMRISSFNLEYALDDRHLFIYSENAYTATSEAKLTLDDPAVTIWTYDTNRKSNTLGKHREKLFPNVSFSGVVDTEIEQAGFRKACFASVLKSMGDNKQEEVKTVTGASADEVFGPLIVRRHAPNNTYKMYSVSDVYREYRLATYGKVIQLRVHNSIGPPLGTTAIIIALANDHKVRADGLDNTYSDKYILVSKLVEYSTVSPTTTAKILPTAKQSTTTILTYVSNNYGTTGFENVTDMVNMLKDAK
jgi:hypothetical protein